MGEMTAEIAASSCWSSYHQRFAIRRHVVQNSRAGCFGGRCGKNIFTSDRLGPEVLAYLVLLATALGGFVGARWWAILIAGFVMSAVRASSLQRRVIEIEKEWRDRRRTIGAPAWAWVVAASTSAHLAICAVFYGIGLGLARIVFG